MQQHIEWNPTTQLWETEQADLFSERQAPFSETWPTSGMTRSGRLLPLPTSAHHIGGNGCSSLLPTPRASDGPEATSHGRTWSATDRSLHTLVHLGELPTLLPTPLLPSPVARQSGSTPEEHLARKPGRTQVTDLAISVENGLM